MMLSNEEIAASLLNRLHQQLGHQPELEQIDFVPCENDGEDTMAYAYDTDGACTLVCFRTPPFFEPTAVEALMLRGITEVVVH